MKVRCSLCVHESNSFCSKKRRGGNLVKIAANKSRVCDLYEEDVTRVLDQYRKKEAHNKKMHAQALRNARIQQMLAEAKSGVKGE